MKKYPSLFILFASFLWAVDSIILRPELYSLPVDLVVFIESTIATFFLLPLIINNFNVVKRINANDWKNITLVALFGGALGTLFITKALFFVGHVNLSVVVLIQKTQPIFAILFAKVILKEKPEKQFYFWSFLALIGTYILSFGIELPTISEEKNILLAVFFSFGASISFGLSTVLSKKILISVDYKISVFLRLSLTGIILLFIIFSTGSYSSFSIVNHTQWFVFFIIFFSSGALALFLYYFGLQNISAYKSAIAELGFPISAILLEFFIYGKILSYIQIIGAIILLSSILKISFDSKKENHYE